MTRSQSLLSLLFLALTAFIFTWQSSRADEEIQNSVKVNEDVPRLTELKLMERIESLEQRISKLEQREELVRQADNSSTNIVPAPRELPTISPEDGRHQQQQTNGTTWSFRTLSHRRTSNIMR